MNEDPNELTIETLLKSARGEKVHRAKDAEDLFEKLGIQDPAGCTLQSPESLTIEVVVSGFFSRPGNIRSELPRRSIRLRAEARRSG
jgi:hypothetical protein